VTTDTAPDFDLGPLTWVQGEIDQALSRGLDALALFKASPHEITSLRHARSHVHQAAGAIQMVGRFSCCRQGECPRSVRLAARWRE